MKRTASQVDHALVTATTTTTTEREKNPRFLWHSSLTLLCDEVTAYIMLDLSPLTPAQRRLVRAFLVENPLVGRALVVPPSRSRSLPPELLRVSDMKALSTAEKANLLQLAISTLSVKPLAGVPRIVFMLSRLPAADDLPWHVHDYIKSLGDAFLQVNLLDADEDADDQEGEELMDYEATADVRNTNPFASSLMRLWPSSPSPSSTSTSSTSSSPRLSSSTPLSLSLDEAPIAAAVTTPPSPRRRPPSSSPSPSPPTPEKAKTPLPMTVSRRQGPAEPPLPMVTSPWPQPLTTIFSGPMMTPPPLLSSAALQSAPGVLPSMDVMHVDIEGDSEKSENSSEDDEEEEEEDEDEEDTYEKEEEDDDDDDDEDDQDEKGALPALTLADMASISSQPHHDGESSEFQLHSQQQQQQPQTKKKRPPLLPRDHSQRIAKRKEVQNDSPSFSTRSKKPPKETQAKSKRQQMKKKKQTPVEKEKQKEKKAEKAKEMATWVVGELNRAGRLVRACKLCGVKFDTLLKGGRNVCGPCRHLKDKQRVVRDLVAASSPIFISDPLPAGTVLNLLTPPSQSQTPSQNQETQPLETNHAS